MIINQGLAAAQFVFPTPNVCSFTNLRIFLDGYPSISHIYIFFFLFLSRSKICTISHSTPGYPIFCLVPPKTLCRFIPSASVMLRLSLALLTSKLRLPKSPDPKENDEALMIYPDQYHVHIYIYVYVYKYIYIYIDIHTWGINWPYLGIL